ncbi:MAG: FKBP-type peptidyl-prolyl cis-trans isomerase [Sphingomonadales bacterium]
MKLFNHLVILLAVVSILVSCSGPSYQKTAGGMPYQLFSGKDTQVAKSGEFLKIHLLQQINDSVYFSTGNKIPLYIPIGGQSQPYDISELWTKLHVGDSIVATQMMDTFIKRMPPGNLPPQFKNGDRIITKFKVLGIFANDSLKRLDEEKETKSYAERESKEVETFLGAKIKGMQRTPSGAYVEILTPGSGEPIKSGNYVSVNYTGSTFAGKVFDSNTDTSFKHAEPLRFNVGVGQMIKGFDEAMPFMRKGGIAKVYIPSTLGYGAAPPPGAPIKPYEHLIFDFTVLDVQDSQPAEPKK